MELSDWNKVIAIVVLVAFLGLAALGTVSTEHFFTILTATLGFLFGVGFVAVANRVVRASHFVPPISQHLTVGAVLGIGFVANAFGFLSSILLVNMVIALLTFTFGTTVASK